MTFTEQSPIETGFAEIYRNRVAPGLDEIEAQRRALLKRAQIHAVIPLGIALVLALLFLPTMDELGETVLLVVVLLGLGGVPAFFLWRRQAKRWGGTVAATVMPEVCDFLGELSYDKKARDRFEIDRARALGVIGFFHRSHLEDRLEGRYRDTGFELVEARLRRQRTSDGDDDDDTQSWETVFQGLLIRIETPEPVPTRILIAREHGAIGNKLTEMFSSGGRDMPKVAFDHEAFEAEFEVYADDPDAARQTMPPAFLDNLLAIGATEGGRKGAKGMTAGFQGNAFFLALDRRESFMEMGGLTTPAGDIEDDLHRVFEDIATIRRIIDRLHGIDPAARAA